MERRFNKGDKVVKDGVTYDVEEVGYDDNGHPYVIAFSNWDNGMLFADDDERFLKAN